MWTRDVAKPHMTKQRIITLMMTLPGDANFKLMFSAFAQYTPTWIMLKLLEKKTSMQKQKCQI